MPWLGNGTPRNEGRPKVVLIMIKIITNRLIYEDTCNNISRMMMIMMRRRRMMMMMMMIKTGVR